MKRNRTITTLFLSLALATVSIIPSLEVVHAQACLPPDQPGPLAPGQVYCPPGSGAMGKVSVTNPISARSIPELVNNIVRAILGVVGAVALAMFVYGGLTWMTSAGNSQRIEKGKETLIWATTGLLAIFLSYGILSIILRALSGASGS